MTWVMGAAADGALMLLSNWGEIESEIAEIADNRNEVPARNFKE